MKNWKKLGIATLLTVSAFAVTAQAGTWEHDGTGYTYLFDSNAYARDQITEIDGQRYGFDAQAHMLTDWQTLDGNWYYFEPAGGTMQTGWQYLDNNWYYLDPSTGAMQTGFLYIGPNRYYFNESGVLQQGGFFDAADGYSYYADENGVILRNSSLENASGVIYVFDEFGHYRIRNDDVRTDPNKSYSDFVPVDDKITDFSTTLSDEALEAIHDKMDELYDTYERHDEDSGISNSKKANWENNVWIKLGEKGVSSEDIDEFIHEVEYGYYTPYYQR